MRCDFTMEQKNYCLAGWEGDEFDELECLKRCAATKWFVCKDLIALHSLARSIVSITITVCSAVCQKIMKLLLLLQYYCNRNKLFNTGNQIDNK